VKIRGNKIASALACINRGKVS